MRIAVNIATRDRPTEVGLLLESLRHQTEQRFDVFILDDCSGQPITNYYFVNLIIARLKKEGHKVFLDRTDFNYGVSRARQELAEKSKDYDYILRVDDDVIIEPDYIERLLKVLDKGYDIASGVTPPVMPTFIRDSKFVEIANRVVLDEEGNFVFNGDDCGMLYTDDKIVPAHHFRSCALMKKEVHDNVKYWPTKLSKHGFREEEIFSLKAGMQGYKIGVDLGAIVWHLMTPSGGERFAEQNQMVQHNEQVLKDFVKENKEELKKLFPEEPKLSKQELIKENNLIR